MTITEDVVKQSWDKLKNGKSSGIDCIPNEFLKNGGPMLCTSLVQIFNLCKLLETFPDDWYRGIVKPLLKEGKPENLSNYRGITITSNVYKVFSSVLETQYMSFF